jgi:hypothetical protein
VAHNLDRFGREVRNTLHHVCCVALD